MIKIGKKAKVILENFCNIEQSMYLRDDYLYSKASSDAKASGKGVNGISAIYELPAGEIEGLDGQSIGIYDMNQFIKVLDAMDEETLKLEMSDPFIQISDKNKDIDYETTPMDWFPQRQLKNEELLSGGSVVAKFVLTDENMKEFLSLNKILNNTEAVIVMKEGEVYLSSSLGGSSSNSRSRIKIDKEHVFTTPESEETIKLSTIDTLPLMLKGDYDVEVIEITIPGKDQTAKVIKFSHRKVEGLFYIVT